MTSIYSKQITLNDLNNITDYRTPLDRINQRQMNQLDRQHQYLRERDVQAEKADPGVVALNTFKNILEFGGSLAKLKAAYDKAAPQRLAAENQKIQAETDAINLDMSNPEVKAFTLESGRRLQKQETIHTQTIWDRDAFPEADKQKIVDYYTQNGGANVERMQKVYAYNTVNNLPAVLDAAYNGPEASKWGEAIANAQHDPALLRLVHNKIIGKAFDKLNIDRKYVAANYSSKIDKFLSTKESSKRARIRQFELIGKDQELLKNIESNVGSSDPNAATRILEKEVTGAYSDLTKTPFPLTKGGKDLNGKPIELDKVALDKVEDKTMLQLEKMAYARKLQMHEVDAIRKGDLEFWHPAGKKGKNLLKDWRWKRVIDAVNASAAAELAEQKVNMTNLANTALITLKQQNVSLADKEQLKKKTLLKLQQTLGKGSEQYKQLENFDETAQTQGAYQAAKEEWKEYYDGGSMATKRIRNKKTIEQIPNDQVSNELLDLIKEDEEYYRANGANSDPNKQVKDVISGVIKPSLPQKGNKLLQTLGGSIPDNTTFLARHLADERNMFHNAARKEYPNNPTAAYAKAELKFKEWYEGKGLNVVDEPNSKDERIGIFSPDINGNYTLYEQWRNNRTRASEERIKIGNEHNMVNWVGKANRIAINAQQQNVTPTEYIAQGNNVITKEDALATVMGINDGRTTKLHFTPEVVTVARWLQIPPTKLVALTIENVINQDSNYAKLHNFPQLLKKIQPMVDTEEEIKALLKESDSRIGALYKNNLLFTWNHGLENAQPGQLQKLLEELAKKADIKYHKNKGSGSDGSFGAGTYGKGRPSDSQLKI